jgi:sugar O-acyltransferase (sialic acid O-acetyltransferase NeuD family)
MRKRIVIVGAGGFGREVFQLIDKQKYEPVGFVDHRSDDNNLPSPIIGDDSIISQLKDRYKVSHVCIALGNMERRRIVTENALEAGLLLPPVIHPGSVILSQDLIEGGVIIYPNVVVMNECTIGRGVLLNSGVTLGHDVKIGEFSSISPGVHVAGRIEIGKEVLIGIGSSIKENVKIGNRAIVGAGSVVLNDVPDDTTVCGIPAKAI